MVSGHVCISQRARSRKQAYSPAVSAFNAAHPNDGLETKVRFLPYQLNPALNSSVPESKPAMYEKKFGPRAGALRQQMADRFTAHGLSL